MNADRQNQTLLKILYLDAGLTVLAQVSGQNLLVSLLFALTFPLTGLLWLSTVRESLTQEDLLLLVTEGESLAAVLTAGLLSGGELSISAIKKWVIFSMTLLFFQAAHRLRPAQSTVRLIQTVTDGLTLLLLGAFVLGEGSSAYLTLGFQNPNLAGLFLTCLYLLRLGRIQGKFWPIHGIFALILGFLILKTQSRNCILVGGAYTLYWLFRREKPLPGGAAGHLTAWFPAIFAAAYLLLLKPMEGYFGFLSWEGKGLDSRLEIWSQALEAIAAAPLTGSYGPQFHNSHLDIAASYGIPALMLTCLLMTRYLRGSLPGFACCLLLGMGESALFSGGLGIYLFAGVFLLMKGEDGNEAFG